MALMPAKDSAYSSEFRLELAYRWAPIHYQDVDRTGSDGMGGRADYITAIDLDGEWNTLNNWENAARYPLTAHGYYSVVETDSHWYIVYAFYHPRDWTDVKLGPIDKIKARDHENDLEGLLAIVKRPNRSGGDRFGQLLGIITVAHSDFYSFVPRGSPLRNGREDIDGTLEMEMWDGRDHPKTAQESKGHGLKAWPKVKIEGGDGVVYYPSRRKAEEPEHPNDRRVLYKLVDIFDTGGLWSRRENRETFASYGKFRGDRRISR